MESSIPVGHFADIGHGQQLHYHELGSGPAVIFLHGAGGGASGYSNFKGNYPVFAHAGFRAIVPDLLGFGLSSKPDVPMYDLDFFVDGLKRFVDALGLQRFTLLGNSLGGAIALGRRHLGLPKGPLRLEESQAAAAVGQIRLAHAYKELLEASDIPVAQVLLTLEDSEQRRRYLNARATLNALLARGAVPVINENDTVATAEIRYGDNDRLAARVAQMVSADCVLLLSDIDGLYSADPNKNPAAQFIPLVR
ncbi:MAG: glutamate 5-kinase, partial [Gammaproteobacteria bacterium]|nr:glutamate 5-kinase [Gammaproteobacteria bacterium]